MATHLQRPPPAPPGGTWENTPTEGRTGGAMPAHNAGTWWPCNGGPGVHTCPCEHSECAQRAALNSLDTPLMSLQMHRLKWPEGPQGDPVRCLVRLLPLCPGGSRCCMESPDVCSPLQTASEEPGKEASTGAVRPTAKRSQV